MKARVYIKVYGLVQGVGFRASTYYKAKELGLAGYVKNLETGEVEILAEGEKEKLEELIEWAKKGPKSARVEKVEYQFLPYEGTFRSFEIKY